jgi:cell division septation protein DedD
MKRCPTCSKVYADDQLSFCLADGARLLSDRQMDSQPTLLVHKAQVPPTIASPGYVVGTEQIGDGKRTQTVPLILMLTAGLVIGLLIAYIALRSPSTNVQPAVTPNETVQQTTAPTLSPSTAKETVTGKDTPTTKETSTKPRPVTSDETSLQGPNWFVVFGTFASTDSAGAQERFRKAHEEGFSTAYIVNTNEYPNFTPGKLAVVAGPYSESEAQRIGKQVQFLVPTIKRGW